MIPREIWPASVDIRSMEKADLLYPGAISDEEDDIDLKLDNGNRYEFCYINKHYAAASSTPYYEYPLISLAGMVDNIKEELFSIDYDKKALISLE